MMRMNPFMMKTIERMSAMTFFAGTVAAAATLADPGNGGTDGAPRGVKDRDGGTEVVAAVPPPALQGRRRLLFYGDSLTDGSSYPDYVVHSLNAAFPDAGFTLENSAKAGDTARDLLRRFEVDVAAKEPDLVSICIGGNDAAHLLPVDEFKTNLLTLVRQTLDLKAQPVLFLTSPRTQPDRDADLQPYLEAVREVAAKHDVPLADAYETFGAWERAGKEVLGPDGIHHGPDGFPAMARAFLDGIGLNDVPLVEKVVPWPGAFTEWEVSEPIDLTAENRESFFALENAAGWRTFEAEAVRSSLEWYDQPFIRRGAVMPLAAAGESPSARRVAFARTTYVSPREQRAELQIGGSPPLVVYCNGEKVWHQSAPHGYHPNADRVTVTLNRGVNTFVVCTGYMAFLNLNTADR